MFLSPNFERLRFNKKIGLYFKKRIRFENTFLNVQEVTLVLYVTYGVKFDSNIELLQYVQFDTLFSLAAFG